MMSIQVTRRLITVEEYHRMFEAGILTKQDRVELINGEILEMSPIGKLHAAVVDKINKLFNKLLGDQAIIRVQSPVQLSDLSEPEPDISVLRPVGNFYATGHPGPGDILLIIEVAESSVNYDKEVKMPNYALSGIPEFWLVDVELGMVETYRNPSGNLYLTRQLAREGDQLTLHAFNLSILADQLLV